MVATFIEGFDYYTATGSGSALPLTSRWTISNAGSTPITTTTGRYPNSQAMSMTSNTTSFSFAQTSIGTTPLTSMTVGFSARFNAFATNDTFLELFNSSTSAVQVRLSVITGGIVRTHLAGATVSSTSSSGAVPLNTWVYIEFEMVFGSTNGRFTVYVNGTSVTTVTLNTSAQVGADFIKWYCNSTYTYAVDDLYVSNSDTRLGESRVIVLAPNADTAQKNFQTSPAGLAGNYLAVNGLTVNSASYIYGGTQGWKDTYDIDDMPFNPVAIHGIQPVYVARKDDSGTMNVRVNLTSGSTTVNGPTNNLSLSTTDFYRYSDPILTTNPSTGLAWKSTDVNSMKIGPEIV